MGLLHSRLAMPKIEVCPKEFRQLKRYRCVPSLEELTAVVGIELIVPVSIEMCRGPCVFQSNLNIFWFDWSNLGQVCNTSIFQYNIYVFKELMKVKVRTCFQEAIFLNSFPREILMGEAYEFTRWVDFHMQR